MRTPNPHCTQTNFKMTCLIQVQCVSNLVTPTSKMSLLMFTSPTPRPRAGSDLTLLHRLDTEAEQEQEEVVKVKLPRAVTRNGSLYLAVFAVPGLEKQVQ